MPRHPEVAASVRAIKGSVYSSLANRLESFAGETYPLHVGDTWMEPAAGCRMEDLRVADHPGMHRYTSVHGLPALVDAVVERVRQRSGAPTERRNVLITAGGTGGLGAVAGAILDPGDEVLLLAPYWPLIEGIVRSFHGRPVDVDFIGKADSPESALEVVSSRLHPTHRRHLLEHALEPQRTLDPGFVARGARRMGRDATISGSSPTRSTRTIRSSAPTPTRGRWRRNAPSPATRSPRPTAWRATAAATWSVRPR